MLNWEYVLDVPPGTVLTDESVDAFVQAFQDTGYAKETDTANGTYPAADWQNSRFEIPPSISFGTKHIPGTNPFYFVNQEDENGDVYAHFGHLEAEEIPEIMVGSGTLVQTFDNYPEMNNFLGSNRDKFFYVLIKRGRRIPRGAFSGLDNVTTVVFQTTITEIGDYAFTGSGISSIDLSTVQKIGTNAFQGCNNLRSLHVPGNIKTISEDAFRSCQNLMSVQLDEGIKMIETRAFGSCFSLTNLVLPEGLTSIGASAFNYCYALKTVSMPNSVTMMGDNAFDDCEALETINLSTGLTNLGIEVFQRCYSLNNLDVPGNILSIDSRAFKLSRLKTIYIAGANSIAEDAFQDCPETLLITINKPTDSVAGSPWGARNATVVWTG